jgi:hypothetical protein
MRAVTVDRDGTGLLSLEPTCATALKPSRVKAESLSQAQLPTSNERDTTPDPATG